MINSRLYNLITPKKGKIMTTVKPAGFRDIAVRAEASSIEKWRKQVLAGQPETGRMYAFISDEGTYMPGGEGTAPSPLSYFVAGMAL
jgi:hypothetical protein